MQDPQQTDMQTDIESVIHQDELQTVPTEAIVTPRAGVNGDKGRVKVPAANGNGSRQSNFRLNNAPGLQITRRYTKPGEDVYSTVEWEMRNAVISNERGEKVFEQTNVEIPKSWTQLATNVVVSKYFRGHIGTPERESSVRQLISRVADTIAVWGRKMDYFASEDDAQAFQDELTHILLHQKAAFNSPVWFNVGLADQPVPQVSACQPYHARVLTEHGPIAIGELVTGSQIGTRVFDGNGLTSIQAVKHNGRKQVFRIELEDGYAVEATADHLVCAHQERRTKRLEWQRVEELAPGMKMRVYPHAARTYVAARSATEISEAALAGWLQADGFVGQYVTGTNRSLTLEFLTNGEEEHQWVLQHLEVIFPQAHFKIRDVATQNTDTRLRRIRLYGEHLRPFVEKYDLLARGVNIRVPAAILTASDEAVIAYLSSVYQAEGYVSFCGTATHVGMAVISEQWASDIQVLLSRIGVYTRRYSKQEKRVDRHNVHVLDIALLSERAKFAQCVGFLSEAKSAKLLQSLANKGKRCPDIRYSSIKSITPVGEMDVYDIQTESSRYLSEGVLVHNCFINSVDDTMESILTLAKTEGMLFKFGSGTGTNLSTIRGSNEPLKGGGTASGPLSFMRGFDQFAGAIKSGGKCFKRGTLVSTPEGWLPIETLQTGDMVLTHKGPRPIADFMPNGWKPCYKVSTEEGYEIEITEGHKFAFWNVHEGRFDVKPIEHFLPGEALYILLEASESGTAIPLVVPEANDSARATTIAEMTFPSELNDKLGYLLGLMYGDAELRTEYPYRVRVAFCKDAAGDNSLARFRQYSKELFGAEPILMGDESGHQQVGFTRKRLIEFLAANGIAKGKAGNLGFPKMLFQARPEVRAAFIAGFIDADGTYQKRGGWSISGIDRAFLVELQRLLLTLGVPSKLKLNREEQGNWKNLYRLSIVGHTFICRLMERILPYSAKANLNYAPSGGADKGWGYRPSLYTPLKSRLEGRGGHGLMERRITMNETTGYRGLVATIEHPHAAVAEYAEELSHCVQVHLQSVELTEMADTYDIEVEDVHLLSANGFYASNTRRAAKMSLLDIDHPDVEAFIVSKADEEKKAHALIDAGYSGMFNVHGGAYDSVQFQNANHSVRVTDEFMQTYLANGEWATRNVLDKKPNKTYKTADLMNKIGASAWVCGDPGMQYDTTINKWHTCKNTNKINASNPCCITGDTLVAVADGRNAVAIKDLVGTETPVYAHDHGTGHTTIARMWNIGVKRENAPIHEVTLDDGSRFRVTDDHLIMLRDGSYRMVRDLKSGDSLMPFHSKVLAPAKTRTLRRYYWTGQSWQPQYRAVWQHANGLQPEGWHIHHQDYNALNDLVANLQLLPAHEHNALHGDRMRGDNNPARRCMSDEWRQHISEAVAGANNPNYGRIASEETRSRMRSKSAQRWASQEERMRSGQAVSQALAKAVAEGRVIGRPRGERYERCCPVCRANYVTARVEQIFCGAACRYSPMGRQMSGEKTAAQNRGRALTEAHRAKLSVSGQAAADPDTKRRAASASHRNAILKAARLMLDNDVDVSLNRWDAMRSNMRALGASRVPTAATVQQHFQSENELREAAQLYNHKVASVVFCGYEDVYDGTVDIHHNFAILTSEEASCAPNAQNYSGIFIHNSEFVFLDDTACNLASLNLMKFRTDDFEFDVPSFEHACRILITAQEILVDNASYPTPRIQENSHDYRPLGLGYANLGALLMARGVPYDSDAGRAYAGAITAIMTGEAYHQSAVIARDHGWPFPGYQKNREPMLDVMRMHRQSVETIDSSLVPADMLDASRRCWDDAIATGEQHGYRNAQATVLAPTGCLVGNSLVVTDRGVVRLTRLGNTEGAQWQRADFHVLTDEGERQATQFYVNGVELTRRITTRAGYAIQGTLKHRVKVVDAQTGAWEWKRFADIAAGDIVPLSMGTLAGKPQTVALPPLGEEYWTGDYTTVAPRTVTPELAELVGYFMGDGSLHAKGPRFCVTNADRDVADRLAFLLKSLFNLDAHIIEQQGYCEVSAHSVPLALWWEACGFAKHLPHPEHTGKGYRPHVPDAILAANDPTVYGAFVRGLFEADGTVTNGVPSWTTTQQTFANEVKTLLLALGVVTTQNKSMSEWGQSTLYVTRLRNTAYNARFMETVGFMGARKAASVNLSKGEQTARYDYVYLDPAVIRALTATAPHLQNAVELSMKRHNGGITRRTAQTLYELTGDPRLKHALGFYYDRVTANEDAGEQFTYDLSVPDNVTYIANGFVSHNTIGFLMDCDTTGIEPDIAIVKYKNLVGGGVMKIVNNTVPEALQRLGYTAQQVTDIIAYIDEHDTVEGASGLKPEHLPIFDCAFKPGNGERSIHYMGHVRMMAAAQPFISGAISKTVNMPHEATAEDITGVYVEGWKLGLKAIAIYRDGSKRTQPLNTKKADKVTAAQAEETSTVPIASVAPPAPVIVTKPLRRKLPDERAAVTHKFSIAGHEGYITVGMYPEGTPGEIFLTMSKEGSTISGLMDSFATAISLALQYGVPLQTLVDKFAHARFEPSGITNNPDIRFAKSIMDYIFRWLGTKFLNRVPEATQPTLSNGHVEEATAAADVEDAPVLTLTSSPPDARAALEQREHETFQNQADAPICTECGSLMVRNGACFKCLNCGSVFGCS